MINKNPKLFNLIR